VAGETGKDVMERLVLHAPVQDTGSNTAPQQIASDESITFISFMFRHSAVLSWRVCRRRPKTSGSHRHGIWMSKALDPP